ncbi:M3 family metallopeptidase [Thalassotalea sp. ND16A]|uniref:M3 family metallopeptidase n=1 Tax=Thalassotalea sp. ND16A TaxID=1535422 RepID=UPI00051A2894|nr:M3 family metallopeptidase [Thalassotalea sp. ND16A]KGJ92442.1 Peptidyl-dipeptidase Dcp [Thalassotalea sp. ND16A]
MKARILTPIALAIALAGCNSATTETAASATVAQQTVNVEASNPFYQEYDTPFGIPPFEKINIGHYQPAMEKGIGEIKAEIAAITDNPAAPTFENTIEAMEKGGDLLDKVTNTFYGLIGSMSTPEMQAISKEMSPKFSAMSDDINLNDKLFQRVKTVFDQKESLTLNTEQKTLLEKTYKGFVRAGANLNAADKETLRGLNQKISALSIQFGENLLNETNDFELVIDNEKQLDGLPESIVAAAAATATARGHDGKWVFTTHRPSFYPFVTYSTNRKLREQLFYAYTHRGDNDNANDNKAIAAEMASLRYQRAQVLGYKTHAHYVLENNMAKTPENAYGLLNKVWPASLKRAKQEVADMQEFAESQGADFKLEAWDWWHYSEKVKKMKYALDESITKPYFELNNTMQGVFYTANQLWGVEFKQRDDLPKYHPDVTTYEVFDKDGSSIGIYMTDFYVRESKRGGAWMSSFRKQFKMYGEDVQPIIYNVLNYPAPVNGEPVLLTFDQASTLFHEFGHAIQGLLSDGHYRSLTGTSLPRDYVEYPSQVMENWMTEPQVLNNFAKHYKTGEVIPAELVEKIQASGKFNQGFATTEYMAAALLDLKWHTLETAELQDADKFEADTLAELGLINEIAPRYRSTYFSHIFAGGYSSGYYGYIWSNIFDADTWEVFKEKGIFDQDAANGYRVNVLQSGGTEDPMTMYKRFRGKEPNPQHLLERRGLVSNGK